MRSHLPALSASEHQLLIDLWDAATPLADICSAMQMPSNVVVAYIRSYLSGYSFQKSPKKARRRNHA